MLRVTTFFVISLNVTRSVLSSGSSSSSFRCHEIASPSRSGSVARPARPYSDRKKAPPALSGDEAAVYAALTPEPILADLLTEHTGLPPQRLLAAMTMLQIKGLAKKLPGNRYQRAGG